MHNPKFIKVIHMIKILILLFVTVTNVFSMEQEESTALIFQQYSRTLTEFKAHFSEWSEMKGNSYPQAKAKYLAGVAFFNLMDRPTPAPKIGQAAKEIADEPYLFNPELKANSDLYQAEIIVDRYGYDLAALDIILNESTLFSVGLNSDVFKSIQKQAREKLTE
jgi:hypothetical protein